MFIHLTFPTALIVMYGPGVVLSPPQKKKEHI